jgi:hypothetical protein
LSKKKFYIEIGQVYNRLTVIADTNKINKHKRKIWLLQCSCGNKVELDYNRFNSGKTKSCGCLQQEFYKTKLIFLNPQNHQGKPISKFNQLVRSYKASAKKRNLEFNLTNDEIKAIVTKPCYYCNFFPYKEHNQNPYQYVDLYNGIDRKDNDKGYILDNCIPSCTICNRAKNDLTYSEFLEWIKRLTKNEIT